MLTRPRLWKPHHHETVLDRAHPLARGLRLCLLTNEGGGSTVYDRASLRHHLTKGASAIWTPTRLGPALSANGGGNVNLGNVPYDANWAPTGAITVVWLGAIESLAASRFAFSYQCETNGVAGGWGMYSLTNSSTVHQYMRIGGNWVDPGDAGTLTVGRVTHCAQTYDGANHRQWIEGTQQISAAATGAIQYNSEPLDFGVSPLGTDNTLPVTMAGFWIYDRALSTAEMRAHAQQPFSMFAERTRRLWLVSGADTYTGTSAISLPVLTADGTGTFTAPVYTGSAAISLPVMTASGTGAHSEHGTAAINLPVMTAAGTGTHTAPTYTATAAITLPVMTAAGSGTFTAPVYTGSAAINLPPMTADGAGTHTAPTYTATAAITLPVITASGAGTFSSEYLGDGAATLPTITADGAGTFTAPVYTGSAAITLPVMTADGTGIFASAVYSGTADITLPPLTASGTGTHTAPTYTGTAALTLPVVTADGAGTFTAPVYTATSTIALPVITAAGSGTFTVPTYAGTAAITLPVVTAAGSGTHTAPVYTGTGAATLPPLTASGAGTWSLTPLVAVENPSGTWGSEESAQWGDDALTGAWSGEKRGRWG